MEDIDTAKIFNGRDYQKNIYTHQNGLDDKCHTVQLYGTDIIAPNYKLQ